MLSAIICNKSANYVISLVFGYTLWEFLQIYFRLVADCCTILNRVPLSYILHPFEIPKAARGNNKGNPLGRPRYKMVILPGLEMQMQSSYIYGYAPLQDQLPVFMFWVTLINFQQYDIEQWIIALEPLYIYLCSIQQLYDLYAVLVWLTWPRDAHLLWLCCGATFEKVQLADPG